MGASRSRANEGTTNPSIDTRRSHRASTGSAAEKVSVTRAGWIPRSSELNGTVENFTSQLNWPVLLAHHRHPQRASLVCSFKMGARLAGHEWRLEYGKLVSATRRLIHSGERLDGRHACRLCAGLLHKL